VPVVSWKRYDHVHPQSVCSNCRLIYSLLLLSRQITERSAVLWFNYGFMVSRSITRQILLVICCYCCQAPSIHQIDRWLFIICYARNLELTQPVSQQRPRQHQQ
jgi:hypothetical protein